MIRLGDLVVAVFDEAAHYTSDPSEVSRLATQTVRYLLLRDARRTFTPLPPPSVLDTAGRIGRPALARE